MMSTVICKHPSRRLFTGESWCPIHRLMERWVACNDCGAVDLGPDCGMEARVAHCEETRVVQS